MGLIACEMDWKVSKMLARFSSYLRETGMEMKRVSWPSIAELKESTVVVMITVLVITLMLFFVDKILDLGMKQLIKLG
jgi:preprotein translocase subunit SecE